MAVTLSLPKNIDKSKTQQFTRYYELTKLNDKKLASLNPQSVINTLATIFELDLSNNPIKKEIALIPYGQELQVQIQEDGFLTLLQRSNCVIDFQREIITNKHIYNEETQRWELNPSQIFQTKQTIGYFGSITIKNSLNKPIRFIKGMTKAECEEHRRKYSKANGNSPWTTSFDAMALKTVIKAIIRDINKTPTIKLENQILIDRAMQIDQSAVINEEEITYIDNPKNDTQKIKLQPIINNEPEPINIQEPEEEPINNTSETHENKPWEPQDVLINHFNKNISETPLQNNYTLGDTKKAEPPVTKDYQDWKNSFNYEEEQEKIDRLELD